jgi:ubiquinone/menaquinone biosynthesis C-methylase UbiE
MLFPDRIAQDEAVATADIALYDHYLDERRAYKEDLCEAIATTLRRGSLLEFSSGWGYTGIDVLLRNPALDLTVLYDVEEARLCAEVAARSAGVGSRRQAVKGSLRAMPFPTGRFDGALSTNALHRWADPVAVLREAYRVVRPGGVLFVNDLRRDVDEAIAEYVVREMREDDTVAGAFNLRTFVTSWRAAYTVEEIRELLESADLPCASIEPEGAMTVTVQIVKPVWPRAVVAAEGR